MHHVIIGAGPAGVTAAETIRKHAPESSITLIGDEPEPPYSRMAIPYLLMENIGEAGTYLRKADTHYDEARINLLRQHVSSLDRGKKTLTLDDGKTVEFDRLLIATGSRPVTPPIPGIDLPAVQSCWTMEDARAIISQAKSGSNVVLMGAGFIGCIILEALAQRGVNLVVVEMENRMVPRMMNEVSGNMIKAWCESRGISVHTSTRVQEIDQDGAALKVKLENGSSLPADLVISATGVRSNIDFLAGTGIQTNQGVLVNEYLQSSHPGIYAAGDVAEGMDFSTRQFSVQAIQPTAVEHGRIAGLNMAGRVTAHHGSVNMNVLDTLGLISCSFGLWMGVEGGSSAELSEPENFRYLNLQFQDDVLVGASSIGLTQHVGVLRGMIESRLKLSDWRDKLMRNPTRIMEAYISCTQELSYKP
jgi:NAD(P)H-nitrite reductase large subunit